MKYILYPREYDNIYNRRLTNKKGYIASTLAIFFLLFSQFLCEECNVYINEKNNKKFESRYYDK